MAIVTNDGKLVSKDGTLGSGEDCCCGPTCDCTAPGSAPAIASDEDRGLVWLQFSACIGSGAAGTVDAPRAAAPCDIEGMAGPITGATVTNGGSGYARLGRVQPTVTASAAGGTGAAFSVTLAEESENLGDGCMPAPYWSVASVSVTNGGSGYSDGVAVTFSAASGDTTVEAAKAYAYFSVAAPVATATVYGTGTGAALSPTFAVATPPTFPASRGGPVNPPFCGQPIRTVYTVTGFTITDGGSGYSVDDIVEISFSSNADGVETSAIGSFSVSSVDQDGAITAVAVNYGGNYGGSLTDELAEVVVEGCAGGAGNYYREDASAPPYVADVTVTVNQEAPSTGSGAVITATVEDDTASANFGKVTALTVADGGTAYLNTPTTCQLPDTLYFTWNGITNAVPLAEFTAGIDGQQGSVPTACNSGAQCRGGGYTRRFNGGDATIACYFEFTPRAEEDAGNISSGASATVAKPACKCGGKIHLTITYQAACRECVYVYREGGEELLNDGPLQPALSPSWNCGVENGGYLLPTGYGTKAVAPGYDSLEWRTHYTRQSTLCLRFDMDENGCPVGDAEVVSIDSQEPVLLSGPPFAPPHLTPCAEYDDPVTGTHFGGDPAAGECPCDQTCMTPATPQVSFMP
jgi:hypothetical protein